ncbi:fatty acyl-CoA synthetase [Rhodococcus sp. 14-2483-1-2]|uniref:fatty acyl-CoA synthetase n=1 Tax=Rhodococcus sp. 14-2483-1-2 TaxID=2023147 RepID=UPI000B9BEF94|nr:fatty acyl-CoA synthetase [Rhodococcus sp. 14-2483-1-2]OZF27791.1 acyl-CoA synthetase [Rhodococcus sp. 14-2483-1-2]
MTISPRANTVDSVLHRSAVRFESRIAVVFGDRQWTYGELDEAVSRAATWLLARGLSRGDRVATLGHNSDAYLIAFLGCSRAGLVHVPINSGLAGAELLYLFDDCEASLVLVDMDLMDRLSEMDPKATVRTLHGEGASFLTGLETIDSAESAFVGDAADTDTVQLLYTSGTTSKPKGAIMSHRALTHEYMSSILALDCNEFDRPLHAMPLYHSAGMHVFLLPYLAVGATNHIITVPSIPAIIEQMTTHELTAVFLAPTVWVPLVNHPTFEACGLPTLRKAFYGASIMPAVALERLRSHCPKAGLYNCFGQSEIGPMATVLRPDEHAERPLSCGRSVMFVELRVVDAQFEDVAAGEMGEILYRSPQLCDGYWNKPEATAEAFHDGWFRSGDLARRDEEGYVTIVDRIKDVINTGGVLVASREVEDVLYGHPAVAEVAVIGMPHPRWIEAVTAFVVRKPGMTVDETELITHGRTELASFKLPKMVVFVDELPRNSSGKLLKRQLRNGDAVAALSTR